MGKRLAVAAMACAVAFTVAPANAADGIRSTITIAAGTNASGGENLKGKVLSSEAKCRRGRDVRLFWDSPKVPGPDFRRIRSDTTGRSGAWLIRPPGGQVPPGRYYAKVTRKQICKPDTSRTITVFPD